MINNLLKSFKIFLVLPLIYSIPLSAATAPGVNKYSWRASLEAVKFLPLKSADPWGGVIITDWYSVTPEARYKVDIRVLSGILNAQSVQVSVFKQIKSKDGVWVDTTVSHDVANTLEEHILNQAKILRAQNYN